MARYFLRLADREVEAELEETPQGPRIKIDGDWYPAGLRQIGNTSSYLLTLHDRVVEVIIEQGPQTLAVDIGGQRYEIETSRRKRRLKGNGDGDQFVDGKWRLLSPLTGVINQIRKQPGDRVEQNDVVIVIEAMKMLNELRARKPGRLTALHVSAGQRVELGMLLLEISEA